MSFLNKSLAVAAMVAATASPSYSAQKFGMAGCGVGSLIFADKPGSTQILAAITNAYFVQSSSITSGTSNCVDMSPREEASLFITINREALAKDISRGEGEALVGLSKVLRCSSDADLGTKLQQNYQTLFPAQGGAALSESIEQAVKSDAALSRRCGLYG